MVAFLTPGFTNSSHAFSFVMSSSLLASFLTQGLEARTNGRLTNSQRIFANFPGAFYSFIFTCIFTSFTFHLFRSIPYTFTPHLWRIGQGLLRHHTGLRVSVKQSRNRPPCFAQSHLNLVRPPHSLLRAFRCQPVSHARKPAHTLSQLGVSC